MSIPEQEWQEGEINAENYRAFLLRCWQEPGSGQSGEAAWRFTLLQLGQGGARQGFASLEELVAYLDKQLAQAGSDSQPTQESNISD